MKKPYTFPMDVLIPAGTSRIVTILVPPCKRIVCRQLSIFSTGAFNFNIQVGADFPFFAEEVDSRALNFPLAYQIDPPFEIPGGSPFSMPANDLSGALNKVQVMFNGWMET